MFIKCGQNCQFGHFDIEKISVYGLLAVIQDVLEV